MNDKGKYYFIYFFTIQRPSALNIKKDVQAVDTCGAIPMHPLRWMRKQLEAGNFPLVKFYKEISKDEYEYFLKNIAEFDKQHEEAPAVVNENAKVIDIKKN